MLAVIKKELSLEESVERLIKILEYTCPYEANIHYVYNSLEEETLFMIVRNKRICGQMTDEDIDILKTFLQNEESKEGSSWNRKGSIKRLLAGILQEKGEIGEGERLSRECLKEMLEVQDFFYAKECLEIIAECISEKDKETAVVFMKAVYWLCDLCRDNVSMDIVGTFLHDFWGVMIETL